MCGNVDLPIYLKCFPRGHKKMIFQDSILEKVSFIFLYTENKISWIQVNLFTRYEFT